MSGILSFGDFSLDKQRTATRPKRAKNLLKIFIGDQKEQPQRCASTNKENN
jgi:hypothetical protein